METEKVMVEAESSAVVEELTDAEVDAILDEPEKNYRLEPLGDRVVIRPAEEEEKVVRGLVRVNMSAEKPQYGEVVSTGPDVTRFSDGAVVLYGKYTGTEVDVGDETLIVVREQDVLGILHEVS
jgi:chaperonin GroES